ncbi:class I SAM-dependent methyltransferase [Algoriphagus sp. CAU 1675]|uniref:class I SAM-dependent methyltransferase n=1 Tax=Algoriphagus sp. CAU 1675 TaxID=3032597 RepID=UPI0023DBF10C|nr:class I SAM-dependent methyltransferase [Algoriphagus sp. CAU 1675]MDF2158808.1 class I SAM-dependent methyltransferase [Algoriphagus sp. CAU 1675]
MHISDFHSAEFQQFVQDHLQEDPALLLLKYQGKVNFELKAAVQQIAARQKVAKKLPEWTGNPAIIYPASISLEQCSSEETAKFKAEGESGKLMIDLTGGFGVDAYFLSKGFEKAVYCEQQEELFQISSFNLKQLAPGKFEFYQGDGLALLKETKLHFDLIYADPARRGKGNQKLYKIQDCEPDLVSAWDLLTLKSDRILLKYSPMLDISQALEEIPAIQRITVLSVKNEVKELLLHWDKQAINQSPQITVQDLGSNMPEFSFSTEEEEQALSEFGEAEKYLIEPLSGILKAGAFKLFGKRFGLKKLEKNSHLYTSFETPKNIPGRVFEILEEIPPKKQELKKRFPNGKANVLTRNYASGSEELKKKFGLKDGGEDYLIGTKTQSGFKIFWCKRVK